MSDNDYRVAIHEAGHFVTTHILGHNQDFGISIVPSEDSLGHVAGEDPWAYLTPGKEVIESHIISLLAGLEAEFLGCPDVDEEMARFGASSDIAETMEWLEKLRVEQDEQEECLGRLRAEAQRILSENWDAVVALASELITYRSLDETEAALVVKFDTPGLESYRALRDSALRRATR